MYSLLSHLKYNAGDLVIVEADRGQDLGTVQHADVTPDQARNFKKRYGEEQYKWLMMFSKNNSGGNINPNAQVASASGNGRHHFLDSCSPFVRGEIADRLGGNKCVAIPLPPAVPVPDPVPEGVRVVQCKS